MLRGERKELMKNNLKVILLSSFLTLSLSSFGLAQWQDMAAANLAFDQQMFATIDNAAAQNQAQMQQLYMSAYNDPQVQAAYQQSGMRGSYDQFVYWYIMTANGTNVQGALQAQQDQFTGLQQANDTVQQGNADYNGGYWNNQNTLDGVYNNTSMANRGNGYYQDPTTGATYDLPYASMTPGSFYEYGGNTFTTDQYGQYYQWNGFGWQPLNPMAQ
jgi:hypothetical protein